MVEVRVDYDCLSCGRRPSDQRPSLAAGHLQTDSDRLLQGDPTALAALADSGWPTAIETTAAQ